MVVGTAFRFVIPDGDPESSVVPGFRREDGSSNASSFRRRPGSNIYFQVF
jgi:hypothetical protein